MRRAFAHEAVLTMAPGGDVHAPGAAITVELCGHWEHEPPCPLSPHRNSVTWVDGQLQLRTLFVVDPASEGEVRRRIDAALAQGELWQVKSSGPSVVLPEETERALRLAQS